MQKISLLLILIGISLPILAFPFTKGYNPKWGFLWSIGQMEIVLSEGVQIKISDMSDEELNEWLRMPIDEQIVKVPLRGRHVIPYKCPLFLGMLLITIGIGLQIYRKSSQRIA